MAAGPKAVAALLAAALAGALAARGAAAADTLADAWRMALGHDGEVAASRSDREAAQAERTAAERSRWPALDLSGGYTKLDRSPILSIDTPSGPFKSPKIWNHDGYASAAADVSVPLWTSGRIRGSIEAARAGARGALAREAMTTADVKLAVAESFVDVLRARQALVEAESTLASLRAHASDVQAMYDRQAVPRSDQLAAQVALANAEQTRLRARNALQDATAAYDRWIGAPLDRPADLEPPAALPADARPISQLVAQALANRPELAALAAQRSALQDQAHAERAQGLPQVALHAGYDHFDNQILDRQNFAMVGVTFQWKLFDAGSVRNRAAALDSRARAADRRLRDLRSRITLEVRTAVLNRDDAAARLRAAGLAVEQAEENVRDADELYRSGLGTNTEVLQAEALRATALTNRDAARYDLVIAGYRIERALGVL